MKEQKMIKVERPFEDIEGNETLVLSEDGMSILSLNPISLFLWKNCNNKKLEELVRLLFEQCNNNTDLVYEDIYSDCKNAVAHLAKNGLIRYT